MNRIRLFALLAILPALIFHQRAGAQVIVDTTTYNSPNAQSSLVQNVLLGNGVIASNFTFVGDPAQIGFFKNIGTNLGLDSGIVLSSGNVYDIMNSPANLATQVYNSTTGDPDLLTILSNSPIPTQAVNDVAILEFDFVPIGDSVKFDYVFGSEEYPDFVCDFNDVFGLFISGPGITGPYTNNAANIALVPGTSQEVSISTINNGDANGSCAWAPQNAQYYIDNSGGTSNTFDAFTTVLTARSLVQCGETYHVKMAICDAGDWSYDSGIFLRAKSFVSSAVAVQTATLSGDSTIAEGCGDGIFSFFRPGAALDTLILPLTIGGTATNGVDYNTLTDTLIFLPGVSNIDLIVTPVNDGLTEPMESVSISFTQNICGTFTQTSTLYIIPLSPIVPTSPNVNVTCPGDTVTLTTTFTGGYAPFNYQWSNGDTLVSTQVSVTGSTAFYVTISDGCNSTPVIDTIFAIVPLFTPVVVSADSGLIVCPGGSDTLIALATGGFPGYTYTWYFGAVMLSQNDTLVVNPAIDQTYVVVAQDACGSAVAIDSVFVNIQDYTPLIVDLGSDIQKICPGLTNLDATVSGGGEPYTYAWSTGSSDTTTQVQVDSSRYYYLTVTDFCGIYTITDSVYVIIPVYPVVEASAGIDTSVCPGVSVSLSALAVGGSGTYSYLWTDATAGTTITGDTLTAINPEINATTTFLLTVTDVCGNTDTSSVTIALKEDCEIVTYNIVTPNGDSKNDFLVFKNIDNLPPVKLTVFNRWGNTIYKDEAYKNNWSPSDYADGTYYYSLELQSGDTFKGFFSLQK